MIAQDVAERVAGRVLRPGEAGFVETSSLWNSRFERRADLAVMCQTAEDVAVCIDIARREGVPLSVKGGGHSYAAKTIVGGGVLADLSEMNHVQVDPIAQTVTLGGGATCGMVDAAAQEHGLAVPLPTVSSVGVAGAALGGGSGYLSRQYGLSLDNLIWAEVVTASGDQVEASERENSDLFWALRGGGGNFGVATSLKFRLHRLGPEVLAGQIVYPIDNARKTLALYADFMAAAPDDFQCYAFFFRIPPIEAFPQQFHGQPALDFVLCHQDPEATDFVQPLRELGRKILDVVAPTPYTEVQQSFDANLPKGQRYYSKAHDLDGIRHETIETVLRNVERMQGTFTVAYFDPGGGAIAGVGPAATAYSGRATRYGFHILAGWTDVADDNRVMDWARNFHEEMAPLASGGVYVNLVAEDEDKRVRAAYGQNWERLVELKRKWDPSNVFRGNYNIPPSG